MSDDIYDAICGLTAAVREVARGRGEPGGLEALAMSLAGAGHFEHTNVATSLSDISSNVSDVATAIEALATAAERIAEAMEAQPRAKPIVQGEVG